MGAKGDKSVGESVRISRKQQISSIASIPRSDALRLCTKMSNRQGRGSKKVGGARISGENCWARVCVCVCVVAKESEDPAGDARRSSRVASKLASEECGERLGYARGRLGRRLE
jgi:hypothetical protein